MRGLLGVVLVVVLALVGQARAEQRVALIVGNGEYRRSVPRLENAVGDARAMERALKAVGFETVLKVNATRRETYAAINAFASRLAGGAIGLFYYAGHGIQAGGRNYMLPVDADIQSEDDLKSEAVDIGALLKEMDDAHNPMNIVILDSCRDNPLPRTRSMARGLTRMESPRGSFIAYAAAPGQTARDGPSGGSGVFTGELVKQLAEPGLKIEDVFKRVTARVSAATGGQQTPWTESSIQEDFYFRPPAPQPVAPQVAMVVPPVVVPPVVVPAPVPVPVPAPVPTPVAPGKLFRDCPDCPEMVMLPPGQFVLGTAAAETRREGIAEVAARWEQPQKTVTVRNEFAIGRFLVTKGEYARFVEATGYAAGTGCVVGTQTAWRRDGGRSWRDPGFAQSERDPVVCVGWEDARAYAAWLSQRTGKTYRLPGEAEWEYAARAGTATARWWGDEIGRNRANCNGCGSSWDGRQTSPVGSFPANPFGLHDMLGNAWQWVEDCWSESYAGASGDAGVVLIAGGDCSRRVVAEGVGRCPGRISIADGRVNFTNGLMLRTTPNEAALPVGGLVVFAGARADEVTSVTFARPGQAAVALPVRGGQVRWEMVPVALVEGGGVLTIAGRQALHQAIPVRAGRDAGALVIEVAN